jgi:hypothetical protein
VRVAAIAFAAVAAAAATAGSAGPAARASGCAISVVGGSSAENAAAQAVVCRMPGTAIKSVEIHAQPPDAPPTTAWLTIAIPYPSAQTITSFLVSTRGRWEAHIAAAAVRDKFVQLGLRRVVAYDAIPPGTQPDPDSLFGIALPSWGIRRWMTGAPSRNLGKRADTWPVLQAKLSRLAKKYRVRAELVRYQPLGKAPLVWIKTPAPGRFAVSGGFEALERTLHFREARYDGVFIGLIRPYRAGLLVWASYRGRPGEGCGWFHAFRGTSRICPSQ